MQRLFLAWSLLAYGIGAQTWPVRERLSFPTDFATHHPQGLLKIGPDFFLSSVDKEKKRAWIFKFRLEGEGPARKIVKVAEKDLTLEGDEYHPGGLDYDPLGQKIYTAVAKYRKDDATSTLVAISPRDLSFTKVGHVNDHIGTVAIDTEKKLIYLWNWDSLAFYSGALGGGFKVSPKQVSALQMGLQDCKYVGRSQALCSGLRPDANNVSRGFLARVTLHPQAVRITQVMPVPRVNPDGTGASQPLSKDEAKKRKDRPLTNNPLAFEAGTYYMVPHDEPHSTLFIMSASPN